MQAMEGPAKSKDSFKLLKLVEHMNKTLEELVQGGPKLERENCCDKLESASIPGGTINTSPREPYQAAKAMPTASYPVPASDLAKSLLAMPPMLPSPRFDTASYSIGPQNSPAFTDCRRKQLRSFSDDCTMSFDSTTDGDSRISASRIDNVADQVGSCNRKVDGLTASMAEIQRSLASVMQCLDRN